MGAYAALPFRLSVMRARYRTTCSVATAYPLTEALGSESCRLLRLVGADPSGGSVAASSGPAAFTTVAHCFRLDLCAHGCPAPFQLARRKRSVYDADTLEPHSNARGPAQMGGGNRSAGAYDELVVRLRGFRVPHQVVAASTRSHRSGHGRAGDHPAFRFTPPATTLWIYDDRQVIVENWHAELWIDDKASVYTYLRTWKILRESAACDAEAQNLVTAARRALHCC